MGVLRSLMLGLSLTCLMVLSHVNATYAQNGNPHLDIGGGLGIATYTGDLNLSPIPRRVDLQGFFLVRYELNELYAVRGSFQVGSLGGKYNSSRYYLPNGTNGGKTEPTLQFAFSGIFFTLEAGVDVHFMRYQVNDYVVQRNLQRWFTPYVTTGVGVSLFLNRGVVFYIPIGVGAKFALSGRLTLAPEVKALKLFSDKIDGWGGWPEKTDGPAFHNRDWVATVSVTLTYRLLFNVTPCPAYTVK